MRALRGALQTTSVVAAFVALGLVAAWALA